MNVGIVGNPRYPELAAILASVAVRAASWGLKLYTEPSIGAIWPDPAPPEIGSAPLDAVVTLGGDGTLLRGARILASRDIPLLGINLGRVGFLTACTRFELDAALERLAKRDYVVEPRLALGTEIVTREGKRSTLPIALNDVAVHKAGVARMIQLAVKVDGQPVGPYSADGLIIATPTGSTAYSLSAGGPIIAPDVEALLITPVCAHTLAVRPLVIPAAARVTVEPIGGFSDDLLVSLDGQESIPLELGSTVEVRQAGHRVGLIRFGKRSYFARMRESLRWGDLANREIQR